MMPKVKGYTPLWLSQTPGRSVFAPGSGDPTPSLSSYATKKNQPAPGPRRTIAKRGTEIFVAVGKEIRWADLISLRETWANKQSRRQSIRIKREDSSDSIDGPELGGYRTIKTPVADDIRQLIISPHADFLAVLTTHTCHVCILPPDASSHLSADDTSLLRPKFFTVGSSVHVTSRSPIVSALWHPLGVNGSCLVTVTEDSIVRVFELSATDRWSFERSTQAIDLKKLADGSFLDQDFSASTSVTNSSFSPDSFEMKVAAAAFGGRGSGKWSPMTLWIAMREGDIYSLCPLLPERWAPPPTLIPSLSVSIVSNLAAVEDDVTVSPAKRLLAQQQFDWMSDLDNQEPQILPAHPGEPPTEVYSRPMRPGAVPRLQGPFAIDLSMDSEDDLDNQLTDIFVIGEKTDVEDLMDGEDQDLELDTDREGLPLSVVCLLSASGQVRVCLDLGGVEAQWLPPRKHRQTQQYDTPSLLAFQSLDVLNPQEVVEEGWPMFSGDVTSRYSFYVTHGTSITYLSLSPWVFRLDAELQGESEAGSDFRIDLLVKGKSSERERLYSRENQGDGYAPMAACTAIRDPDVGFLLLSATPHRPVAITLEAPETGFEPLRMESPEYEEKVEDAEPDTLFEPRPVFLPPHVLEYSSALPGLLDKLRTSRHKTIVHAEVKLSPVTLQVFTDAHQILSEETHRLGIAAAELFRRSEQLREELKFQITKANEVRGQIQILTGEDESGVGDTEVPTRQDLEARTDRAKERQKALNHRIDDLKKRVSRAATRELSAQELSYITEVKALEAAVNPGTGDGHVGAGGRGVIGSGSMNKPWKRLEAVEQLQKNLVGEADRVLKQRDGSLPPAGDQATTVSAGLASPGLGSGDLRIPQELRKRKMQEVKGLLLREEALLNAVVARLEQLTVVSG